MGHVDEYRIRHEGGPRPFMTKSVHVAGSLPALCPGVSAPHWNETQMHHLSKA